MATNQKHNPGAGVFASALNNRKEIDEVQLVNLADDVDINIRAGVDINTQFRNLMETCAADPDQLAAFYDFKNYGSEYEDFIDQQRADGAIAAVDGTDRLPPTAFPATTLYVTGVAWATTQNRGAPEMYHTSTTADLRKASSNDTTNLFQLADELDKASQESSWATCFREYCEREVALNLPDSVETCFIDGPIFTQGLMTQAEGRDILGKIISHENRRYIGVIKGLDGSWALCRWAATALKENEVYVISTIQAAFTERFQGAEDRWGNADLAKWVSQNTGAYVRCVYKPKSKAFAFECALDDLPYAVALLRKDASPQINHETPTLLHIVDAACRRSNCSSVMKNLLLSKVQKKNPLMAADLTDERTSR